MNTLTRSQTAVTMDRAMHRRLVTDKVFKVLMSAGGIGVIVAVSAIFFYLASVVVPLFVPPSVEAQASFAAPGSAVQRTGAYSGEEQREIGVRIGATGDVSFFGFKDGRVLQESRITMPAGAQLTSFALADRSSYAFAYGLSDGRAVVAKQAYKVTFPDNKRLITPGIEYPLGEDAVVIDPRGSALQQLAVQHGDSGTTLAGYTADGRLLVSAVTVTTNLMTGESRSEAAQAEVPGAPGTSAWAASLRDS
ncbi:MAG TPA: phosphate ABC transporter permease, partial [Noviherbaspirillum sp.]|nr:phosphate ABC transporter permease [Noviherbaspirillum sp.]